MILDKKLELVDIIKYIPYGLKVVYTPIQKEVICTISTIDLSQNEPRLFLINDETQETYLTRVEFVKPLLYPQDNIIQKMLLVNYNDNKPFIPLVEIVKHFCENKEVSNFYFYVDMVSFSYKGVKFEFRYEDNDGLTFCLVHKDGSNNQIKGVLKTKQYKCVFNLLDRFNIDYNDLITNNLAYNINEYSSKI